MKCNRLALTVPLCRTLLWAIQELAHNGTKPNLTDFRDYESYVRLFNEKTDRFIRQLP